MSDKQLTYIMSDLHVGGGPADPGDDHIWQGEPLVRLLDQWRGSAQGQAGAIELVFNGDFLEFAQTNTAAFAHLSDKFWCTESESLAKLNTILAGNANMFAALARFQETGNLVTIAAGNHDVDLAWPAVQARLRQAAGADLRFEIGQVWLERHDRRLQIGHGHMDDVANRFEHWDKPILAADGGPPCLEMCPGTLFMVKFVNHLEAKYPFADNLLPVTKLLPVLLRDDKRGLASVGWLFMKLVAGTSLAVLEAGGPAEIEKVLLARVRDDAVWRQSVAAALGGVADSAETLSATTRQTLLSLQKRWLDDKAASTAHAALLQDSMLALLGRVDDAQWQQLFEAPNAQAVLGADDGVTLNALRKAAFEDGKKALRLVARDRADATGAEVVVMGHTHQTDQAQAGSAMYFNPGCWTRYLELAPGQQVTLDDLRDESRYPYALNYVKVASGANGPLQASLETFEKSTP